MRIATQIGWLSCRNMTRRQSANNTALIERIKSPRRSPIGFGASQQIGSYGGYDIVASAKVDVEDLINNKLKIDIDRTTGKIDVGIQGGNEKIVGAGVGIKASIDSKGQVNIEQVSAEIGAAGFGVGASIGANSSAASASAFGVKIEIGRDETGVSAKICYSVGVGEVCTEIKPRQPGSSPSPSPSPSPTDPESTEIFLPEDTGDTDIAIVVTTVIARRIRDINYITAPAGVASDSHWETTQVEATKLKDVVSLLTDVKFEGRYTDIYREYLEVWAEGNFRYSCTPPITEEIIDSGAILNLNFSSGRSFIPSGIGSTLAITWYSYLYENKSVTSKTIGGMTSGGYKSKLVSNFFGAFPYVYVGRVTDIIRYIRSINLNPQNNQTTNNIRPNGNTKIAIYSQIIIKDIIKFGKPENKLFYPPIPNPPQKYMPCDCCKEIKEIYKYLGIEKLKKHKFPIAKQFLVPGGKGTEDAEDYYAITQALFRMLANGLILNPKSKPLGSEWQNANATAWASAMYEMMAEAMSDGNSSQRFEIHTMMQLVQMMSAIAETSRKVEFIADELGFEPDLIPEELPVLFTIHEEHKGFGKKELKKINVSGAKTDNEVEEILGKMLNPSKIPIVKWQFKPGEVSIKEALNNGT